ncbi:MAG: UDPGP type 1 family protein, partial [Phycisphaeraceae bacterium]
MPQTQNLSERYERAQQTLKQVGQDHLLTFYKDLGTAEREQLLDQIESQDWALLSELVQTHVKRQPEAKLPETIEPAPYYPAQPPKKLHARYDQAREHGEQLIAEGKVAAFVVAGGQGTRLGWEGPKGTFPATPIEGKPLFCVFAEYLLKVEQKYGRAVPWYVMTSPVNDAATRAHFEENQFFGLDRGQVHFFPQGVVPSFDLDGRALLTEPGKLATNPDGHGGSLRALHTSGALQDMADRGIQHISYFQVDNPLVRCIDPLFIGLHAIDRAQMSSKMVVKAGPLERVGNFCLADGRVTVIEYSDLPDELAEQRNADGSLRFNAGSIAIHVIDVDFVRELNRGRFGLPFHRAVKKVPHVDLATGNRVEPTEPNAVKLETFVFDALPLCERSIVLETLRQDEFAPIK